MASRNYAMAYDTPYNKRLIQVLERYDAERDTNGEPQIFNNERLEGGAFVGGQRGVYHPHLFHPLMSTAAGDLEGGFSLRDVGRGLKSVAKGVGKVALPIARDVGQYALQEGQKELTRRGRDYVDSYLQGGAMGRPPGMVSPFIHGVPTHMVQSGTMAAYPMYNAVEMRGMGVASGAGMGCCGCRSCERCGGNFLKSLGKGLKSVGKVALPIATDMAKEAAMAYMMGAGVQSGGIGVVKKPRGRPRKMAMEMDGGKFNFGKALKSVGKVVAPVAKEVGKAALPIATDMAKQAAMSYMMGAGVRSGGASDGRKRRAEIVRKVMAEKGMKMIEASKYVKANGLY